MQDPRLVALLVVLVGAIVTGACLGGMAPRSRAQWRWIGTTVGFLIWLLAGMLVVRAGGPPRSTHHLPAQQGSLAFLLHAGPHPGFLLRHKLASRTL
jgi:hypothetical protein